MKKISLLLLVLCICGELFAINIKEKIARTPIANLPFECTKTAPWGKPGYVLLGFELGNLPIYTYKDLGLTQKTNYEKDARIFRRFATDNNLYELFALSIGESEPNKHLLVTLDQDKKVIDHIEAAVYFVTTERLYMKQWRIDVNQNIIVTWLKVDSSVPVPALTDFSTINAQRIDIYYKIDSSGKFTEVKQVKFHPQAYTSSYLEDKTKNIWNGNEVPLDK